jgi:uncharacterized protein (TIGR00369 family)
MDASLGDGGMPLLAKLGLSFDSYGDGWATARWKPTELACNPLGTVHGGVYGVVHDAAMNFATNAGLASGDRAATLDLKYETMRAARGGEALVVRGEVVRLGRQVAYVESWVRSADAQLISHGTATFFVRRRDIDKEDR